MEDDIISNSSKDGDNFDKLQRARTEKSDYAKAAMKFNFKPKNGIAYLVAQGLIHKNPKMPEKKEQTAGAEEKEDPEFEAAMKKYNEEFNLHICDMVRFLKSTPALDKTA